VFRMGAGRKGRKSTCLKKKTPLAAELSEGKGVQRIFKLELDQFKHLGGFL